MPKYFLSLTIYIVGAFAALYVGEKYDSRIATITAFLLTFFFAYLARKINPTIDKDVQGYVKHGDLYAVILLITTIIFVALYVLVFGYWLAP